MRYHTVEDIIAANQNAYDRLADSITGLNEEQAQYRPGDGQWSISEIAEHVSIVSNGILKITYKLLKAAEAEGKEPKPDLNLGSTALDDEGNQPPKLKAPEMVHPKGADTTKDSLANIRETLTGFVEIKPRIVSVDLFDNGFPHPYFGELNAYQWMILLGEHMDRHRSQIESVKESIQLPS